MIKQDLSNAVTSISAAPVYSASTHIASSNLDGWTTTTDWNVGITLNEDCVKEACRKIIEEREKAKLPTLLEGPEIPKWTGFIEI